MAQQTVAVARPQASVAPRKPPAHPALYEIHTRAWLHERSRTLGGPAILDDVEDEELDRLATLGFDWVWLLGIWRTGPASRAISMADEGLRQEYHRILPDLDDFDICGSPYAVQAYRVHRDFGGEKALLHLRRRLADRGLRLMLDFVPNHTALDHDWVREHPEYYVHGSDELLARDPRNYCRVETGTGPRVLAHGRDPYFPGWTDTLQLNYRHGGFREAMIGQLLRVAGLCDGVRCDMAMLVLPDIFRRTWGDLALPGDGSPPVDADFWPEAIGRVRAEHPEFLFMAEAYWDLEWTLQQQGFDTTYDKRLYDRLHSQDAGAVRAHLWADLDYQRKSARFLENHDEPRAAAAFPPLVHQAAAVATFLTPGLRLFHEGQLTGRKVRLSVHLGRRPDEPVDAALLEFYGRLLEVLKRPEVRDGRWRLLDCLPAWDGNSTAARFLAYAWEGPEGRRLLAAINYGPTQGQCYVPLPCDGLRGRQVVLQDLLSDARYERDGDELAGRGLYLDMPAWGHHAFELVCA